MKSVPSVRAARERSVAIAMFDSRLVRIGLIFDLLRAFLRLVGSLVRSSLGRMLHRMTRLPCGSLRRPAGVFGSIFRCVPSVLHILFWALFVPERISHRGTGQGNRQE